MSKMGDALREAALQGASDSPFLLCPNGQNDVGGDRNKLVLNTGMSGPSDLQCMVTIGQLMGCGTR